MKNILTIALLLGLGSACAWSSNIYEVKYEGNVLPEDDPGWWRVMGAGGAIRYIEKPGIDGAPGTPGDNYLVIDSLASQMIYDYAWYSRPTSPDGPLERFRAEWRVFVPESHGTAPDQGVSFTANNGNVVALTVADDHVYSVYDGWTLLIEPGIFHTYRLESVSMVTYDLWVDNQLVRQAPFFEGLGSPYAAFGDLGYGGQMRSLAKWDYLIFSVYQVPEPDSFTVLLGMTLCECRRRKHGLGGQPPKENDHESENRNTGLVCFHRERRGERAGQSGALMGR